MKRFLLLLPLFFLLFLYLYYDFTQLKNLYPVVDVKKSQIVFHNKKPKSWVSLHEISRELKWSIVLSEDWAFYEHNGIDFNQLKIVIAQAFRNGELGRGASTITQQLVKNLYLSNERSIMRKFFEMFLAIKMELELPKKRILEIYLNIIELGPKIFGVKAASYYYFGLSPNKLSIPQSAFLAMLLPSPIRYGQSFRQGKLTDFAEGEIQSIIKKLAIAKIITHEKEKLLLENLRVKFR